MLTPNTILQNRYRVIQPLGKGGMGAVYQAMDETLSCIVALKETFATTELHRRAFEREAKLLANLRHSALPVVTDHFAEGDGQFLVMQFVPGHNLAELLHLREKPFAAARVLEWADQLLDALEELHSYQPPIVHRDIKPANLKLTPKGKIILLDFGLAKGSAGQMSTVPDGGDGLSLHGYTLHYAPLEQIQGAGTDPRSDLYSLAATLWNLLTGETPPDALTRVVDREDGKPDPLRPAHELNPEVPPSVADVLHRAMAINRQQRPADAAEMRRALREAGQDSAGPKVSEHLEPSPAPPAPGGADAVAPARREVSKLMQWLHAQPRPQVEPGQEGARPEKRKAEERARDQIVAAEPAAPRVAAKPETKSRNRLRMWTALLVLLMGVVAAVWYLNRDDAPLTDNRESSPGQSPGPTDTPQRIEQPKSFDQNVNGVSLEMVFVPDGTFMMGSSALEQNDTEVPRHPVSVPGFYMGKYEVTQAQWRAVMKTNLSRFNGDDRPVESVSWGNAIEFCRRLSQMTGREYRLPTEAEWEYACRAGTQTTFAFGESLSPDQACFLNPGGGKATAVSRAQTRRVGSYPPNAFGLYDMHGNVWEWCLDVYHDNYDGAPEDGSAWLGEENADLRVIRGGSCGEEAHFLRSAQRYKSRRAGRGIHLGFRVVTAAGS